MKKASIISIIFMSAALLLAPVCKAKEQQFNAAQVKAMQQIVHDYIVQNPEVLIEASQTLQKQQMNKFADVVKQVQNNIPKYKEQLFTSKGRPVAGNKNGKVMLVEFFDYQCPHCQVMGPVVDKLIKADPDLQVVFIELPIFGEASQYASAAALASMQQGKYYQFHKALTKKGYPITKDDVLHIAQSLGIDTDKLQKDMQSKQVAQQLNTNYKLAKEVGIKPPLGTPAFFVGNLDKNKFRFVPGQVQQQNLQQAIDYVSR